VAEERLRRASDLCGTVKDRSLCMTVAGASRASVADVIHFQLSQGSVLSKLLFTAALVLVVILGARPDHGWCGSCAFGVITSFAVYLIILRGKIFASML
jgi:hypothetical protein